VERYRDPNLKQSDRIQRIIDYVFGPSYGVDITQRCGHLLWRVKEGLESLYEAQKVPTPNEAGLAIQSNENSNTPVYDGFGAQMNLSDVDLEELFQSFQGGASGTQESFMFGSVNEPWTGAFELDNSLLLGREDRRNPYGTGVPDMSYLQ
jgi:hypothetical protein